MDGNVILYHKSRYEINFFYLHVIQFVIKIAYFSYAVIGNLIHGLRFVGIILLRVEVHWNAELLERERGGERERYYIGERGRDGWVSALGLG